MPSGMEVASVGHLNSLVFRRSRICPVHPLQLLLPQPVPQCSQNTGHQRQTKALLLKPPCGATSLRLKATVLTRPAKPHRTRPATSPPHLLSLSPRHSASAQRPPTTHTKDPLRAFAQAAPLPETLSPDVPTLPPSSFQAFLEYSIRVFTGCTSPPSPSSLAGSSVFFLSH